ncbi:MAG: glycoside hydrolase domain-containing protein [Chloroflexota bacterium]
MNQTQSPKHLLTLITLAAFLLSGIATSHPAEESDNLLTRAAPASYPPPPSSVYLPLINKNSGRPVVEVTHAWTSDPSGQAKTTFIAGDPVYYHAEGINHLDEVASADLIWSQESPCGTSNIYSDILSLPPGNWTHIYSDTVPACIGTYTSTAQTTGNNYTSSLSTNFDVHFHGGIVVSTQQAFDRCWYPSAAQMQTWWDNSPYVVYNIYLGGIHFPCALVTPTWLQSVSQQGWAFILTWVGPQAPCTTYKHRISYDISTAYAQGIDEAAAALAAAESIGLSGEKIIYYDIEAYGDNEPACHNAVAAFLQGWTDWLHLQGDKAGAYGSPCYSYMPRWASNSPPPDDVWIAHWLLPAQYRPDASVWNVGCMSNDYWSNHQRIRQYAGDHVETWGSLSLTIDSNVLDGEITAITNTQAIAVEPQIRDMDLLSASAGWTLQGNRLLMLDDDGGNSWREITPNLGTEPIHILDVEFTDSLVAWLALWQHNASPSKNLAMLRTEDGGRTWQTSPLPASREGDMIQAAHLNFIDHRTGWVVLELRTGSSFSAGRLFSTRDGGRTWDERSIPLGEPVAFVDDQRGWVAGGPSGDQLYRTSDGGLTWQPQELQNLPAGRFFVDLPIFDNGQTGVLPLTVADPTNPRLILYTSDDGGDTWNLATSLDLDPGSEPGQPLPFSLVNDKWWAAYPGNSGLHTSSGLDRYAMSIPAAGLPRGTLALDFVSGQTGWALVQDGTCQGDKIPPGQNPPPGFAPHQCALRTRLFMTDDGGHVWRDISP